MKTNLHCSNYGTCMDCWARSCMEAWKMVIQNICTYNQCIFHAEYHAHIIHILCMNLCINHVRVTSQHSIKHWRHFHTHTLNGGQVSSMVFFSFNMDVQDMICPSLMCCPSEENKIQESSLNKGQMWPFMCLNFLEKLLYFLHFLLINLWYF